MQPALDLERETETWKCEEAEQVPKKTLKREKRKEDTLLYHSNPVQSPLYKQYSRRKVQ